MSEIYLDTSFSKIKRHYMLKITQFFQKGCVKYEISKSGHNGMLPGSEHLPCGGGSLSCFEIERKAIIKKE